MTPPLSPTDRALPSESAPPKRCACPSREARRCYCLRYAPDDSQPKDEVCECSCHEPDEDDEDGY